MQNLYQRPGDYNHFRVEQSAPLLDWLLQHVHHLSRSKVKATLQGRGIRVDGKVVTQFDYPLKAGQKVTVSRTKQNNSIFKNRYVKIVYEDQYLVVIEKNVGVLSMAAGHSSLNVKAILDDYFKHAVTHFHVLSRSPRYSLVEYRLETGRKNQIRVHSADMGHPVCGDVKYGNGDDIIGRLCLHAYILCFYHPLTHRRMEFATPIPPAFRTVFK